jgi:16S rRNA C1402 N4-methylase RsmH
MSIKMLSEGPSEQVHEQGIDKVDFILADLGLCSAQLADSRMGLSFLTAGWGLVFFTICRWI